MEVLMCPTVVVSLSKTVYEEISKKARERGLTLEEFLVEVAGEGVDPESRAEIYVKVSRELLEEAEDELEKGDLRQASEKIWGAAALSLKAYAYYREGRRLTSHGELWEYKDVVAEELGDWVTDSWFAATAMHTNFYEGWATPRDVREALERVKRLIDAISERIGR